MMLTVAMAHRRCDEMGEQMARHILRGDERAWLRVASAGEVVLGEVHRFDMADGPWYSRRVLVSRRGEPCVVALIPIETGWKTTVVRTPGDSYADHERRPLLPARGL